MGSEDSGVIVHHLIGVDAEIVSAIGSTESNAIVHLYLRQRRERTKRANPERIAANGETSRGRIDRWSCRSATEGGVAHITHPELVDGVIAERLGIAQGEKLRPSSVRRFPQGADRDGIRVNRRVIVNVVVTGNHPPSSISVNADTALAVIERGVAGGTRVRKLSLGSVRRRDVLQKASRHWRDSALRNDRIGKDAGRARAAACVKRLALGNGIP